MARWPDGPMVRWPDQLLASAAEPSAVDCDRAASFKAAPNCRTTTRKAAGVGASVIWMSPAVVPGACADKDPAREPAWAIVAVGRASIRIVRVIAVGADGRASYADSNSNAHADPRSDYDRSLRIRERHGQ